MNNPAETDILRFIVAMAEAREDETEVKRVIDEQLAKTPDFLHASMLKVTLRVVIAQFYAPVGEQLDDALGYPITDAVIEHQRQLNEGIIAQGTPPGRPHLELVTPGGDTDHAS